MSRRSRLKVAIVVVASAALAVIAAVGMLTPATVRGQSAQNLTGHVSSADVAIVASEPLSRIVPFPYPYPVMPISRGHVVVMPFWCNWPTQVPPPVPPGVATRVPPTPVPSPTPGGMASSVTYTVCSQIGRKVPMVVQQQALAAPWTIYGYNMRLNPNTQYHPLWNPLRTQLGLLNPNVEYHPCNPVVWKAGCP